MSNIIRANFCRLFRSRLFWLLTAAILIYSAVFTYDSALKYTGTHEELGSTCAEMFCFDHGPVVLLILPVFISLYLGTEFSDGTMRNKIVVGNRRRKIYLADLIAAVTVSAVFCAAWHIGGLSALPVVGIWRFGVLGWIFSVIKSLLFCAALASFLCVISHAVTNKAAVAVFEIFLVLIVIVAGSYFYNKLLEPEIVSSGVNIFVNDDGETVMEPVSPMPNPDYVAEPKRAVYKRVLNALPSGQAILLANTVFSDDEQLDQPLYSWCASAAIIAASTAVGVFGFKRKDLK